jgi:hypothetical protein
LSRKRAEEGGKVGGAGDEMTRDKGSMTKEPVGASMLRWSLVLQGVFENSMVLLVIVVVLVLVLDFCH